MSEPWEPVRPMYCCCGCGREVPHEAVERIEGASVDGIPVVMVYATEECAARHHDREAESDD